jgi:hypothetical protein
MRLMGDEIWPSGLNAINLSHLLIEIWVGRRKRSAPLILFEISIMQISLTTFNINILGLAIELLSACQIFPEKALYE